MARVTRRSFLGTAAAAALSSGLGGRAGYAQDRPNILFLLGDDHRWDVLGAAGNPVVRTPNLDAIANRGTRFSHAFVTTSICMASRATILTGQYTSTHGINDFATSLAPEQLARTYPLQMREAGYYTGFIGKWGVGNELPVESFDFFEGFPGQGDYLHEVDGETRHLTELQGDNAVRFFDEAPADRPFCLSVSFKAPHVQDAHPMQFIYDPDLQPLYSDVKVPVAETAAPEYFERMPEFIRTSECRTRWERRFSNRAHTQQSIKGYYRLVTGIDMAVGQMLRALERSGRLENTIIVYAGDNGMFLGEHGLAGKWLMHEESIRVPMLFAGPGIAAQVREDMVLSNDIAPTLLALAGLEPLDTMQGRNLVPVLQGEKPEARREWFYEYHYGHGGKIPESEGIRTEAWKYIRYTGVEPVYEELYHLAEDPLETTNLADRGDLAPVLEHLRERWQVWRAHVDAQPRPWREPEASA